MSSGEVFDLNSTVAGAPPPNRLLSRVQAARLLGVSDRTLYTLTKAGEPRAVRIGSRVLYDLRDLAEYVEKQKAAPSRCRERAPEGGGR
jgi:excisionase family DNA binding protein